LLIGALLESVEHLVHRDGEPRYFVSAVGYRDPAIKITVTDRFNLGADRLDRMERSSDNKPDGDTHKRDQQRNPRDENRRECSNRLPDGIETRCRIDREGLIVCEHRLCHQPKLALSDGERLSGDNLSAGIRTDVGDSPLACDVGA